MEEVGSYYTNTRPFGNWTEVKVQVLSYAVQGSFILSPKSHPTDMAFSSHPYAEYLIQVSKDDEKCVHSSFHFV
jgi:hypothetical protein